MASRIIIDGDPLVGIAETDPRTEHIVGPLGSLAQAESMCDGINGVVILTRRGDGWHVLKPPIDVAFGLGHAGAPGGGTRRVATHDDPATLVMLDDVFDAWVLGSDTPVFEREMLGHGLGC